MSKLKLSVTVILCAAGLMCLILCWGCGPKDEGTPAHYGIDTLSTDTRLSGGVIQYQGFDFSEGRIRFAEFNYGFEQILDLSLEVMVDGLGEPIGVRLFHTRPAYIDMGYLLLEQVSEAPAENYISEITGIVLGNTYCILTREDKYAKIHIDDIEYGSRASGAYARIRFDWQYQPDGSTVFDELPESPW